MLKDQKNTQPSSNDLLIDLLIVHKLANRSTRPNHIDWADSTLTLITGPNKCYKLTKEKKKKLKINNENTKKNNSNFA